VSRLPAIEFPLRFGDSDVAQSTYTLAGDLVQHPLDCGDAPRGLRDGNPDAGFGHPSLK